MSARLIRPALAAAAGAAALHAAWLWPVLAGREGFGASDFVTLFGPMLSWAQGVWRETGALPRWWPHLFCGMPLTGSMQSMQLYPTELAATIAGWTPPRFYGLDAWLHLVWGAAGAAAWLAAEGVPGWAAAAAGLLYGTHPHLVTQLGSGTTFIVRCAGWLPWLVLACRRAAAGSRRGGAAGALILGLLWLTLGAQVILFGAVWLAVVWAAGGFGPRGPAAGRLGLVFAAGAAAGAVWLLPAAAWLPATDRGGADFAFAARWAVDPLQFPEAIWPGVWGRTFGPSGYFGPQLSDSTTLSWGILVPALAVAGALADGRAGWPWLAGAGAAVALAFGPGTPWGAVVRMLPGLGGFRSWERFLVPAELSLLPAVAAGLVAVARPGRARRAGGLVLALCTAVAVGGWLARGSLAAAALRTEGGRRAAGGPGAVTAQVARATGRGAAAAVLSCAVAGLAVALPGPAPLRLGLLAVMVALDSVLVAAPMVERAPVARFSFPDPVADALVPLVAGGRVLSEEAQAVLNLRMARGLEFVGGYAGIPPRAAVATIAAAARSRDALALWEALDVTALVAHAPVPDGRLRLVGRRVNPVGEVVWIHAVRDAPGRMQAAAPARLEAVTVATDLRRATVSARAGTTVELVEPAGAGWRVRVDGAPARATAADAFRIRVAVPPGRHTVEARYDPFVLRVGTWLSLAACAALLVTFLV